MDLSARYDCRCAFLNIYLQTSVCFTRFSVFSGHTHHSLHKLLYIIILLCVGSNALPLVNRGMYVYYYIHTHTAPPRRGKYWSRGVRLRLRYRRRRCKNVLIGMRRTSFPALLLQLYRYYIILVRRRSRSSCIHRRVIRRNKHNATLRVHTHTYSQIYDTILYWYNMYIGIFVSIYVWHEIYGAYAK